MSCTGEIKLTAVTAACCCAMFRCTRYDRSAVGSVGIDLSYLYQIIHSMYLHALTTCRSPGFPQPLAQWVADRLHFILPHTRSVGCRSRTYYEHVACRYYFTDLALLCAGGTSCTELSLLSIHIKFKI